MTPKYTEWRTRHPAKDQALRRMVAMRLGMYGAPKPGSGAELVVDEWCVAVLSALLGWAEPEPPRPAGVPADVIQAFDLETRE
jgi:hypothetical protein